MASPDPAPGNGVLVGESSASGMSDDRLHCAKDAATVSAFDEVAEMIRTVVEINVVVTKFGRQLLPIAHPTIIRLLREGLNENTRNLNGDTPLIAIVSRPVDKKGSKYACLGALLKLAHSLEINATTAFDDNTALHIAVKMGDLTAATWLIAFGASINLLNASKNTPLDLGLEKDDTRLVDFLFSLGGEPGSLLRETGGEERWEENLDREDTGDGPGLAWQRRRDGRLQETGGQVKSGTCADSTPYIHKAEHEMPEINLRPLALQAIAGHVPPSDLTPSLKDDVILALLRSRSQKAARLRTGFTPMAFQVDGGQWVLSLDGGGMKGLVQIEALMQIEALTGYKIADMFDWIVGTSVGGIVALALVYAKKTLKEMKQMFFEMKEEVFSSGTKKGYNSNTLQLEKLCKKYLGENTRLSDLVYPRVMITAVDCRFSDLSLKFFNNCFDDDYSDEYLWKVARYTSAAPVYFEPMDNYVDGGVRANNPSQYGLTKIQQFLDGQWRALRARDQSSRKPRISCVVSVGCGQYPQMELGDFNVQKYAVFGKQWFLHPLDFLSRFENLIRLLTCAIADSVDVALNCRSRCEEQGIAFYRFDPLLPKVIPLAETDDNTLCDMIITAKLHLHSQEVVLDELVQLLRHYQDMKSGEPSFKKYN